MEVSAVRSAVLRDRNFSLTESSGSKGPLWSPARTIERSQEGTRGGLEGFILLAPFRNLTMRSCFPREPAVHCIVVSRNSGYIHFQGGGWQPTLQPFLQERKHLPSPWERRSFLRGMRQGGAVAREMSSGNQVRVGQWGATSRTCSSSSLSLHRVCASRLTGGNAYLRKARGQLCASASVPRGPSVREKYSWQWEDSGEANRSTWASPNRLQISRIVSGWSRHSPGNVSCRESALGRTIELPRDVNSTQWLETACDSRGGDGGRAVTCGCDRIPPSRLIYENRRSVVRAD